MDPLSVTANVITVLELANSVLTICFETSAALKNEPWALSKLQHEVQGLRNVLETLQKDSVSSGHDERRKLLYQWLCDEEEGPLARCRWELEQLKSRIGTPPSNSKSFSHRRALGQVLSWQIKEHHAKASVEVIERCKTTILLALAADER